LDLPQLPPQVVPDDVRPAEPLLHDGARGAVRELRV
jgi:hypothetical protein